MESTLGLTGYVYKYYGAALRRLHRLQLLPPTHHGRERSQVGVLSNLRWGIALFSAFVVEVALFATVVPTRLLPDGPAIENMVVIPACIIASALGGWWAAQKAGQKCLMHGTLVGLFAALMYAALTWTTALPAAFIVANYAKVIAGAGGGLLAMKRGKRAPDSYN
jgi:putative membrane protein (TIGR04086 family)